MSALIVSLEHFEGPLALLLYLIRKEEMDINDIPIHKITKQYLDHIHMMKKLDLEVASEFITMAAALIHIKSKVLLPQYDAEGEEMMDDPRKDLVRQLVEYQRYQEASKLLLDRPILGRDHWRRGYKEDLILEENQGIELDDNGLFGLIASFRNLIRAVQKRIHRVALKGQSIASRIMEIRDYLIPGERKTMRELIRPEDLLDQEKVKNKVLVTFLSLLELAKMGFVKLFQSEPYAEIHVETVQVVDRDVIQRVEAYDGAGSAQIAESLGAEKVEAPVAKTVSQEPAVEQSAQQALPIQQEPSLLEESASDEDIAQAEQELGFDPIIEETIPHNMEPLPELPPEEES